MYTTMKKIVLTISAVIAASAVMAQSEDDALRFSQTYQQGTARSAAMGGAFGALGGDLSVLSTNPAGMSIYKDGEFSITPCFGNISSKTTLNGFEKEDSKFNFKMSNIGFVTSHHNGNDNGFSGFAFGMTFNRLNDFSANTLVDGRNDVSSHLDFWTDRSQHVSVDDLNDYADYRAYDCYLMDVVDSATWTYTNLHHQGNRTAYGQYQKLVQTVKGGINSWDFAFSGVYAEKIYFGASLGIQTVNYKNHSTFSEEDRNNVPGIGYDYYDFEEELETHGTGINFKTGIIYKPVNFLRFGAAIHTPTFYSLTDKYRTHMYSKLDNKDEVYDSYPDMSNYEYRLYTPSKAIFSAAFIVPNYGLISVDYEYVDYKHARFETNEEDNYDFYAENQAMKDKFKATQNIRVGVEGLVGQVSVRAGYAMYGNPLKSVSDNIQRQVVSGGLGFRGDGFYLDLTGTYHIYKTDRYLYEGNNPASYKVENNHLYIMATLGFKF